MSRLQDDRGLQYGDGLFETMRCVNGRAPLWDWHMQRLLTGCERLRLPSPDVAALARRAARLTAGQPHSMLKLIWTAGSGVRGYARPANGKGRAFWYAQPWVAGAETGLRLRWCQMRLAAQPALAQIKHLNRLEQVLARAEWSEMDVDEGLMLDAQGQVICATAANVFARLAGQWHTPPLDACGIAGIARRWLMSVRKVELTPLTPAQLDSAEAVLLSNAVRGPRWVRALGERNWQELPDVQALRQEWNALFAVRGLA